MAIIKNEDILGYFSDNNQMICVDCITDGDQDTTSDDVITQEMVDNDDRLWFCDVCKQKLN
jgi:hypothetical protein